MMNSRKCLPLLAVGVAAALLTGCGAEQAAPSPDQTAATTALASQAATAAPEVAASPAMTLVEPPAADPFADRLVVTHTVVKAGESMRVTGGTYAPGVTVKLRVSQIMAMPSYDAANDMYYQVGEQIHISDQVVAVTDADGHFDTLVRIPEGTPPQQVDVWTEASDGRADLVRSEIS